MTRDELLRLLLYLYQHGDTLQQVLRLYSVFVHQLPGWLFN